MADRICSYVLAAVLVLLPFHALLTVWLSQAVGHYELLRIWKEALLLLLVPPVAYLAAVTPGLWDRLRRSWLFWCVVAYVALHLLLGTMALHKGQVNGYALVYALVINLRLLLVFLLALVLAARWQWLRVHWHLLVLWPAALVVVFGLLQAFALPADFLRHAGYGSGTIMPFETVDQKLDYVRIQSTLRGANPLGAYLVLVLSALTVLMLRKARDRQQVTGVALFSASLLALVATYSRSAYIGAVIAALTAVWLVLRGRQARRRLAAGLVALAVLGAGAVLVFRQNDRFENMFFHTDEHSAAAQSSNDVRSSALRTAAGDLLREPFGRGPGTAGPASFHNLRPERIAEDYYLQIGQETGWLGLGLFLAINLLIARQLWRRRDDVLCRVLLASLAGIAFINLVQHAWTDDTLGLLWWALAGVALGSTWLASKRPAEAAD